MSGSTSPSDQTVPRKPLTTLRVVDRTAGTAVYADLARRKCPATVGDFPDGCRVTFPCDQPGFVMAVVETAVADGHATDGDGAACIAEMDDALGSAR